MPIEPFIRHTEFELASPSQVYQDTKSYQDIIIISKYSLFINKIKFDQNLQVQEVRVSKSCGGNTIQHKTMDYLVCYC